MSGNKQSLPQLPNELWSIILRKLDNQSLMKAIRVNSLWSLICHEDSVLRMNIEVAINSYVKKKQKDLDSYLMKSNPLLKLAPHEIEYLLSTRVPFADFKQMVLFLDFHLTAKRKLLDAYLKDKQDALNAESEDKRNFKEYVAGSQDAIDKYVSDGQATIDFCMRASLKRIRSYFRVNRRERRSSF